MADVGVGADDEIGLYGADEPYERGDGIPGTGYAKPMEGEIGGQRAGGRALFRNDAEMKVKEGWIELMQNAQKDLYCPAAGEELGEEEQTGLLHWSRGFQVRVERAKLGYGRNANTR